MTIVAAQSIPVLQTTTVGVASHYELQAEIVAATVCSLLCRQMIKICHMFKVDDDVQEAQSDSESDVSDTLYCLCQKRSKVGEFMVMCDGCEDWFVAVPLLI